MRQHTLSRRMMLGAMASTLALAACAPGGGGLTAPKADLPERFAADSPARRAGSNIWWAAFRDSRLDGLIAAGLKRNLDVQTAVSVIREAQANARLESELRDALTGEQFVLEYQPIMDARSGRHVGLEALLRWNHPRMGRVAPGEFVGIAEETGLKLTGIKHMAYTVHIEDERRGERDDGQEDVDLVDVVADDPGAHGGASRRWQVGHEAHRVDSSRT